MIDRVSQPLLREGAERRACVKIEGSCWRSKVMETVCSYAFTLRIPIARA